jgi:hypothetical protein
MYKNLQCGLCGHFNDEDEDVFRMGNGRKSSSLKQFHESYTLKNQECDTKNLNKFYSEQDSQEFSINPSGSQRHRQQQRKSDWFGDDSEEESRQNPQESNEMSREQGNRRSQKPVQRTQVIG